MSIWSEVKAEFRESPLRAVGVVADFLGIATVIFSGFSIVSDGAFPQAVLAVVISGVAITFLVTSFLFQHRLYVERTTVARSARLATAAPKLTAATTDLTRDFASERWETFLAHATSATRSLAEFFELATGVPCRVTFVETYAPDRKNRLAVRRATCSYSEDGEATTQGKIDWVDENTDFERIVVKGADHFLCNDLPGELGSGYRNSHWTSDRIREMKRDNSWTYKSTIVWPVRGWNTGADGRWDLRGFVCVDSKEVGTFDEQHDVSAGATFSNALYLALTSFDDDTNDEPA